MTEAPVLNIVTGPSGAGKSEFCRRQPDWANRIYNLDDWQRQTPEADRALAWEALLGRLGEALQAGVTPLILDHVCGADLANEVLPLARQAGYRTHLWVVCPANPGVCVARVALRRAEGGHGRPARDVIALYGDALANASQLTLDVDGTTILDSSEDFSVIGCQSGLIYENVATAAPDWVDLYFSTGPVRGPVPAMDASAHV